MLWADHAGKRARVRGSWCAVDSRGSTHKRGARDEDQFQRAAVLILHDNSAKTRPPSTRAAVRVSTEKGPTPARPRRRSDSRDAAFIAACARAAREVRND